MTQCGELGLQLLVLAGARLGPVDLAQLEAQAIEPPGALALRVAQRSEARSDGLRLGEELPVAAQIGARLGRQEAVELAQLGRGREELMGRMLTVDPESAADGLAQLRDGDELAVQPRGVPPVEGHAPPGRFEPGVRERALHQRALRAGPDHGEVGATAAEEL